MVELNLLPVYTLPQPLFLIHALLVVVKTFIQDTGREHTARGSLYFVYSLNSLL